MVSRRASFSRSPLAKPESLIHKLAAEVGELIYFPDPDPLYAALGVLAGSCLKGPAVWMVFVGPPSSGKTLAIDMLDGIPRVHSTDMIASLASLLSGTSSKERTKSSTGGILRQTGKRALLSIKDFTCMLSLAHDSVIEVVGALRRVYDGRWDRDVGTDGGRKLTWEGKLGLLSACTAAIDRHHGLLAELGQRWLYYRMPEIDGGQGAARKALQTSDPGRVMVRLRELAREFWDDIGLEWRDEGIDRRDLTPREVDRITAMAQVVAAARSPVVRDYRTREVLDLKETEPPARLAGSLGQLYIGLEWIGLEEEERWRVIGKAAMDSVPGVRLRMVRMMAKGPAVKAKDFQMELGCSPNTVRFSAEDLKLHGVVETAEKGDRMGERAGSYRLTAWAKGRLAVGWEGLKI